MKKYEFDARIIKPEGIDSGYVEFPYDTEKEFGKKGQVKVKAYFDGYLYRGSLVRMGNPCHLIGLNKEVRTAIGKNPGDMVHVVIEEDTEERVVAVPEDLRNALEEDKEAASIFEKLSYSHKRQYVQWLEAARKEETRRNRIEQTVEMLKKGKKQP